MNKKVIWSFILLALPILAQAQENPPSQEMARPQTPSRPDSLQAWKKLNQDRGQRPAAEAAAGLKGAAEKKDEPATEEIDLGTFAIQAVIEKPNVDIIPKRTAPDWEDMHVLERSFGQELKEVPEELMLNDEELDRAQKLETLKKAGPPPEDKKK